MDTEQQEQKKKGQKQFYYGLITGLAMALLIFTGSYSAHRIQAYMTSKTHTGQTGTNNRGNGQTNEEAENGKAVTDSSVEKMKLIEAVIDSYFYKEDTDKEAMINGLFKGMVASLGDPYSEYYTEKELEDVMQGIEGIYYGIGAYVQMDEEMGLPRISGVISGAPAEGVGIRENDYIYAVDGEEVYGLTTSETVALIKGPEGTKVTITFIRDDEYIDIEVERRQVQSPTVEAKMYEDGMAYIQIREFDEVTIDQFTEALAVSRGSGMKGLILDLRSNPGGSLNAVVKIAGALLPKGLIVYTEDRAGNRKEYFSDGQRQLEVPLVVLINGNSASASEILAGAIKDYQMGTLLGTTTFGKGIVQQPISLGDGSAVKLTISSYFTPNGINIHGTGIAPDEECEFDGERYYGEEKFDNQLERAKEILLEKIRN